MKKIKLSILAVIALGSLMNTSCIGVRPQADEEAVLIKHPWIFGH